MTHPMPPQSTDPDRNVVPLPGPLVAAMDAHDMRGSGQPTRIATPRNVARLAKAEEPETIRLDEHPQWPIPLFQDEYADRKVPANSELGLGIYLSEGTWKAPFNGSSLYETDLTIEALCKRWGAPGECADWDDARRKPRIKYKVALWTRTVGGKMSRPVVERTVVRSGLPQDCIDELGEEPWPIGANGELPANTPQVVRDELETRKQEREAALRDAQQGGAGQSGQYDPRQPRDRHGSWGGDTAPDGAFSFGADSATAGQPPLPADPGKKWVMWGGAWLQVPDSTLPAAEAPPPYPAGDGRVWAKVNNAWTPIPDPNRLAPSGINKLIDRFATDPEQAMKVIGAFALGLKMVIEQVRGPTQPPAPPPPPAVDVDAKIAAIRAEMLAQHEVERRQLAEAETQRARAAADSATAALAVRNNEPKKNLGDEMAAYIQQTRQNAKMLGLGDVSAKNTPEANPTLEVVRNIADTAAGEKLAEMVGTAVIGWLGRQPESSMLPMHPPPPLPQLTQVSYDTK